jgi:hypothetical protein
VTATHDAIISFGSTIFPHVLPRYGTAPVGIQIEGHVKARKGRNPVALTTLQVAIHRAADLNRRGLPVCDISRIDPASSAQALAACPRSRIGYGRVRARLRFPGTRPIHYFGRVTIFNGRLASGRPAILLHLFSPILRTSFVFPLRITHSSGRYRTVLKTQVSLNRWSSVTDFKLVLDRHFTVHGHRRSFLNAGCPAPQGLSIGISPFVVATLGFADGSETRIPVFGSCQVSR